jgi:hypothetical protein
MISCEFFSTHLCITDNAVICLAGDNAASGLSMRYSPFPRNLLVIVGIKDSP